MRVLFALVVVCLSLAFVASKAPLLGADAPDVIPGQYLIVFHRNATVAIRDFHVAELVSKRFGPTDRLRHLFAIGTLIGYSATLSKETLASELDHHNVRYIEADQVVTLDYEETVADADDTISVQPQATWGLDRIDQPALPLNQTYYSWGSAGTGVTAYVIDTGVLITHNEFGGRALWGISYITGETNTDGNGHGTHVASTIAGATYGVAKQATIVAVKVLNSGGSGSWDGVIAGISWVTQDHLNRGRDARSVANMSLGGGLYPTVDEAVAQSVAQGVNHAIAAGNSNANACNYSPARSDNAVTVGATTNTDARASFSNFGPCIDVFAPGNLITAAWIGSNTATNTISGTSMASPHVAGVIAQYLGHELWTGGLDPSLPSLVHYWVNTTAIKGVVTSPGTGTTAGLLFSPYTDK